MGNPLNLKEFKHFLNFKSDDTGRIQISEPVKFDGAEFVIEQDGMYARDISYMSEEIDLEFYKGFFERADEPYQLPNGLIVDDLGHAIEYLFEYNKYYGYQSQIEYILERNGIEFILGELNFEGAKTDELTYFNCKVVQNTNRAISKRRADTKVNGFADEDLDGNTITPIETVNMLLKAKPVIQASEWSQVGGKTFFHPFQSGGSGSVYYASSNNVIGYGIDNTLSFLNTYTSVENNVGDFGFIDALDDFTDLSISIDFSGVFKKLFGDFSGQGARASLIYRIVEDFENPITTSIESDNFFTELITDLDPEINIQGTFTIDGLNMTRGTRLLIYIQQDTGFVGGGDTSFNITEFNIDIQATSTSIDTVIKAVRYGDLLRYSLKAVNGMDIIAPDFDFGGKYYDLLAFSGNLIRQRDDVPFYFDLKDRKESFQNLTNGDLQVNETDAFALPYNKFYDNVDNGGFITIPSDDFEMSYNQKYAVNVLEYKFKTYEKDRDESNTLDAVHTEAQFSINNTRVKNTKKIEVDDIFDPFAIESIRRQQFKETTALDGDDKIHCMDAVNLAPSTRGGFTSTMTHNVNDDGNLQLLKEADLPSWGLLGFNIGSTFSIDDGINIGDYIVFEIENTIVTLTPVSITPVTDTIPRLTTVSYPLENVQYVNRTNEGFDLIENLLSPNNFGNLKYTIRRNLIEWESYINTCATYIDENPKNTEFKNNGLLVTQFEGGEVYTENGDINLETIQLPILSPKMYNTDVIAEYDDVLDLIQKYQNIDTVGGFVRVQGNNGDIKRLYPMKLGYTWATKVLSISGEERRNTDFITITKVGGIIYIDEVGYTQDQLSEIFYEANGKFFTIYDDNQIKIVNFTKYDKFIVQEETFDNANDLAQALIDL